MEADRLAARILAGAVTKAVDGDLQAAVDAATYAIRVMRAEMRRIDRMLARAEKTGRRARKAVA